MKKAVLGIALLAAVLLVGFFLFSSSGQVVDEDYLKTEKYQSLKRNIESEKENIRDERLLFFTIAQKMLANQSSYSPFLPFRFQTAATDSSPYLIDEIIIDGLGIKETKYRNHDFYGLLALNRPNYNAVVFIMILPGAYEKYRVILVTTNNSSIRDMASIGQYEKNITEEVNTELYISKDLDIRAEINKIRFYPIKQNIIVNYRYSISKEGNINVTVL